MNQKIFNLKVRLLDGKLEHFKASEEQLKQGIQSSKYAVITYVPTINKASEETKGLETRSGIKTKNLTETIFRTNLPDFFDDIERHIEAKSYEEIAILKKGKTTEDGTTTGRQTVVMLNKYGAPGNVIEAKCEPYTMTINGINRIGTSVKFFVDDPENYDTAYERACRSAYGANGQRKVKNVDDNTPDIENVTTEIE